MTVSDDELIGTVAKAIERALRADLMTGRRLPDAARAAIEASGLLKERDEARNRVERLTTSLSDYYQNHCLDVPSEAECWMCKAASAALTEKHNG